MTSEKTGTRIYLVTMVCENSDYSLFLEFFDAFSKAGIEGIAPDNPILIELEQSLENNNQLIYLSDAILMDMQFISKRVKNMFGIEPEKVPQGYFLTTTHPEDYRRHQLARSKLVSVAQELYIQKKGTRIISTNVRARKPDGTYFNILYQAYLFYSKVPYESVFFILVITDISGFTHIHKGFHYYIGDDRRFFRYPDDKLLMSGNIFSHAEFKVIELINEGLSTKEIANKLFRSQLTVSTHRTNILKKAGKKTTFDVIQDLKSKGLL